jgi:hypothetical protein
MGFTEDKNGRRGSALYSEIDQQKEPREVVKYIAPEERCQPADEIPKAENFMG